MFLVFWVDAFLSFLFLGWDDPCREDVSVRRSGVVFLPYGSAFEGIDFRNGVVMEFDYFWCHGFHFFDNA